MPLFSGAATRGRSWSTCPRSIAAAAPIVFSSPPPVIRACWSRPFRASRRRPLFSATWPAASAAGGSSGVTIRCSSREHTDADFHVANFSGLAVLLAPFTARVIVSFFDPYPKALRRLRRAGIEAGAAAGTPQQQRDLLERFAAIAAGFGLEIQTCAEATAASGVRPGKCIDERLLNELFGLKLPYRKDPAQRKLCLCQQSVDIGSYGSCDHGCLYCYAG